MFEVLVFVYENYWRGDACPEPQHLGRKLSAAGFESDEIAEALAWLDGLNTAALSTGMIHVPSLRSHHPHTRPRGGAAAHAGQPACIPWPNRTTWAPTAWAS
jgi:hypothetical protein